MTVHNEAKIGDIAKTVLMPGDPLRAKYIAENFLDDAKLVNKVRNIYAYTGTYKGKEVTIMASGMGMPSIGVYSYELYTYYNVENIIRIGSAGAYSEDIELHDIILVSDAYSDSSYAKVQGYNSNIIESNSYINEKVKETAIKYNQKIRAGRIYCTDVFYEDKDIFDLYNNKKCLCTEMESFALFYNALKLNKKASCLLTVSDNFITKEKLNPTDRQNAFNEMIILALETTINL